MNLRLTPAECRVVALIRQGQSNKMIAYHLGLSEGTVKQHLNRIYRKRGIRNRTELALAPIFLPGVDCAEKHCDGSQTGRTEQVNPQAVPTPSGGASESRPDFSEAL